jgi:hypothetical protein
VTLIITESFNQGSTSASWWNAGQSRWFQSNGNNNNCFASPSVGRHGAGLSYNAGSAQQAIRQQLPAAAEDATLIMGMAILHQTGDSYQFRSLFRFWSDNVTTMHVTVHFDFTNQRLIVYRGDGALGVGTLLGQTSNGVHTADGIWHYWECKVVLDAAAGSVLVKRDGVTMINLTGVNTKNGGTKTTLDGVECTTMNSSTNQWIDDVYVCNTAGTTNNDFLGDVTIECLRPNNNGTTSGFMGSDGNQTNNYQLVIDATDATYVDGTNTGDKDTYAYADSAYAAPSTILGLTVTTRAYKTDTGARTMASVARLSGTEQNGADRTLTTGAGNYVEVMETKPGGGAWGPADVNAAEFGAIARP